MSDSIAHTKLKCKLLVTHEYQVEIYLTRECVSLNKSIQALKC